MIDDPADVDFLMKQIEAALPLEAVLTDRFIKMFKEESPNVKWPEKCKIISLFYMGDEGGIMCALAIEGVEKEGIVTSLTHLHFYKNMPLATEIAFYQKRRTRHLKKEQAYDLRLFTREAGAA